MKGGDENAPAGKGFSWTTFDQGPEFEPSHFKLPAGIVFGLKHSVHQKQVKITVVGNDPVTGPAAFPGFVKMFGGDDGAPSKQGFYWYETTGDGFTDADWSTVERLPKGTVIGLKQTHNQPKKKLVWKGKTYDPADAGTAPPDGYVRRFGGDMGLPKKQGYYWYEKITCPCSKAEGGE
jgi:hypothetical protein